MSITVIETATFQVTPAQLAKIFWNMDDAEQVQFFEALADAADPLDAQSQWWYMGRKILKNPVAAQVLRSMAAGVYEHTLRYCDQQYADRDMPLNELTA